MVGRRCATVSRSSNAFSERVFDTQFESPSESGRGRLVLTYTGTKR
jgi:hypothetical protein